MADGAQRLDRDPVITSSVQSDADNPRALDFHRLEKRGHGRPRIVLLWSAAQMHSSLVNGEMQVAGRDVGMSALYMM